MKKFYLFLLIVLVGCPAWSQTGKITLDMLVKRGIMNAAKKGADGTLRATEQIVPSVVTNGVVGKIPVIVPEVAAPVAAVNAAAASLPAEKTLATLQQSLGTSLLAVSTDLAQQIVRCGQSYVGFPQYDYLRNFYEKLDAVPEELRSTLAPYGKFMLERKYPGISNADEIAENALEEVSEYIPSYNAVKDALEEAGQENAGNQCAYDQSGTGDLPETLFVLLPAGNHGNRFHYSVGIQCAVARASAGVY